MTKFMKLQNATLQRLIDAGVPTAEAKVAMDRLVVRNYVALDENDELVVHCDTVVDAARIAPHIVNLDALPARTDFDRATRAMIRELQAEPPLVRRSNADARARLAELKPLPAWADDAAKCQRALEKEQLGREIANSDPDPEAA